MLSHLMPQGLGAVGLSLTLVTGSRCSGLSPGQGSTLWPRKWYQWSSVWPSGGRSGQVTRSDNMAVVHALMAGMARDPLLMHLLRCLHFFTATHQLGIEARHVAGIHNTAADALSRLLSSLTLPHRHVGRQPGSQPLSWTLTGCLPPGGRCFFLPGRGTGPHHDAVI